MKKDNSVTAFNGRRELGIVEVNKDNRTVMFSASSEYPAIRQDAESGEIYYEVLSHNPEDVDLSRMTGAPILDNHDGDQIGVVESAEIRGGKMIVRARFGRSARAEEVFSDVVDGIRRNVSVGYMTTACIDEERAEDGRRVLRFKWQPCEVSIVGVPADPTVGIGRKLTIPTKTAKKRSKKIIVIKTKKGNKK